MHNQAHTASLNHITKHNKQDEKLLKLWRSTGYIPMFEDTLCLDELCAV